MKKVCSLLLAICLAMLMAVPAFADGRGPEFTEFDVVCTKTATYYRENWDLDGALEKAGTFPKGTTLRVDHEYEKNDVLYAGVRLGNDEEYEWVYIRLSDVEVKDKTYLPENAQKLLRPQTVRVIEKSGISLYAGPNKKYDVIGTIPRGTKLTYSYGNDEDSSYRTWAYVTYLNKSGWIYVYSQDIKNGVAELPETDQKAEIWVLDDGVKMYEKLSFGIIKENLKDDLDPSILAEMQDAPSRVVGTLEKGEKYTYRYSHGGEYGYTWYYVTSGLRSGWVYLSIDRCKIAQPMPYDDRDHFMAYESFPLKLHKTPSEKSDSVTVNIPKDTVLSPDYQTYDDDCGTFYYTTIDGKSGWYSYEEAYDHCAYKIGETKFSRRHHMEINYNTEAAPIYSDILSRSKTVGKIPAGSAFTPLYYGTHETVIDEENSAYTSFYYVRYNDVTGWVDNELLRNMETETTTEPEEETEDYAETTYEEEWNDEYADENEPEEVYFGDVYEEDAVYDEPQSGLSPLQIVLVCVAGAVVLSLTAAVTLLLIRRKRQSHAALTNEATQNEKEDTNADHTNP